MYVNQSSVSVWKPRSNQLTSHLPESTHWIKKQATHIRLPPDCQHGHLTNLSQSHHRKKKDRKRKKASRFRVSAVIIPLFLFIVIIYFKGARRSVPGYFSAVKCAHIGDAWCVPTAPTDRQTHPAAFPASPLLHPSTSVTLTVRAHLSICGC